MSVRRRLLTIGRLDGTILISNIEIFFFLAFLDFFLPFPQLLHFFLTSRSYVLSAPAIYIAKSVTFGGWEK